MTSPLFIAVVGPTGSGKTALGVRLAKALNSEVVSADSQLVYQGLDIGTAKPTIEEKEGIPHHLIDLVLPTETYTVARYREEGQPLLKHLREQGKLPIVVGGTGLYVRALLDPPMAPEVPPNPAFRERLQSWLDALAASEGLEAAANALHATLREKDPRRAEELHPNNVVRVIRALEIIESTGGPVPEAGMPDVRQVLWLGLTYRDRDLMRTRIDARIREMLAAGWIEEVQGLLDTYGPDAHALQVAHGYPELAAHVRGLLSLDEAVARIEVNIHQYATRQHTWYRQKMFQKAGLDCIQWFHVDEMPFDAICQEALESLKRYQRQS